MSDLTPNPYDSGVPSAPGVGYLPPQSAYVQPGADPYYDPLVAPQHGGVGGWFNRIGQLFRRSWRSTLVILAVTQLVPSVVLGIAGVVAVAYFGLSALQLNPATGEATLDAAGLIAILGAMLAVIILLYVVQLAGYAAATHSVVRQAAGETVTLGESFGYGFRRCWSMFAWYVPVALMVVAGALACVLPAFYVMAGTALVGPVLLFERRNPIGRSFQMLHRSGGRVLGRLALIVLISIAASTVVSGFESAIEAGFSAVNSEGFGPSVEGVAILSLGLVVSIVFGVVVQLPVTMFQFAGVLLAYTEQRGYEGATTPQLNAELR
ncbi:hypothetical protein ACFQY4_21865 [Catellatospora bangladeshensis]|nr:hypothetical protein [Catellatospora bangladeshensis]